MLQALRLANVEGCTHEGVPTLAAGSTANLSACNIFFNNYLSFKSPQSTGPGPRAADFVAWHPYVHLNVEGNVPQAEDFVVALANVRSALKAQGVSTMPIVASEGGWTLVARDGRPIGYVATKDIVPMR